MKQFTKWILIGFVTLNPFWLNSASSADTYRLKLTTFLPANYVVMASVISDWAHELEERSGGRLKIEVYPAGQMGPPQRQFDLARTGVADIALFAHGHTPGRFPLTEMVQLPFMSPNALVGTQILMDLVPDYLAKEHPGTRVLSLFTLGPAQLHLHSKAVRTIEDLRGLRIRQYSKVSGEALDALGATAVNVLPTDIADGLDKRVIDATLFSYDGIEAYQLGKLIKYTTEISITSGTFGVVMNERSYDRLPNDLKKLIDETTERRMAVKAAKAEDDSDAHAKAYELRSGAEIISLKPEEIIKAKKMTAPVTEAYLADLESKGLSPKPIYRRMLELSEKYSRQ